MFCRASSCNPTIPKCRLGSAFCSAEKLGTIRYSPYITRSFHGAYRMVGNFGGLLKFLYLAEFTLAVGEALGHNDIHSKMADKGS